MSAVEVVQPMKPLDGKAIVVTGSGRGIGAAIAIAAAALGARVVVNDIDPDPAAQTVARIVAAGGSAIAKVADITKWDGAGQLVESCVAAFGRIDGLVNNAGINRLATLAETTEAHLREVMEINLFGTAFCAAHAIQHMKRQKSGAIVNVTSGAHMGLPAMGAYGGSKGAVASFTYCWAMETVRYGVRVNAISPVGDTRQITAASDYMVARGGKPVGFTPPPPESNAPVACFLLSDLAAKVNGQIVRIEGPQLSLLSHPGVALPIREHAEWTFDEVAEAFRDDLGQRQMPLGVAGLQVEVMGLGSAAWTKQDSGFQKANRESA
jgi:NAD(P)-dependent dehydrogenase (short-subunit alcohol dehydrogenase family)